MKLISTAATGSIAPLITRIFFFTVFFPHGAQKLLGWFGGFGFTGTMEFFTGQVGLPWIVGFTVIMLEFFGSLALLAGVATRFFSLALTFVVIGIILTSFRQYFFMNWFGTQPTEGMEYFLLLTGMLVSLVVSGAGRFSLDHYLGSKINSGTGGNRVLADLILR
jgi:putative oxidoreductase